MSIFSTPTTPVAAKATADARKAVKAYRDAGNGSNRTDWPRLERLLAAVLQVIATGTPVDVTDLFPVTGTASAYHLAHRSLKPTLFAAYWPQVQVVGLRGATWEGRTVTGTSDTTRGTTVLICPTR